MIRRYAEQIHPHCPDFDGEPTGSLTNTVDEFAGEIQSLEEEIQEQCISMLEHPQQSTSLTTDQALEVITSILENVLEMRSFFLHALIQQDPHNPVHFLGDLVKAMEDLEEELTFLKSLIRFTAQRRVVELAQDLFGHAADISIRYVLSDLNEGQFKISTLAQEMKPIDPQVFRTYTQALSILKSDHTQEEMVDTTIIAMNDILHYLISKSLGDASMECLFSCGFSER
ncbi:OLC1v1036889C1 [Oldenlandia corymbosa var. corymbosa]|uniref:OLC1v1036889C1 n=1 Tax=Oldenlandia corymbosa var. corymbosa TaxID=529605 RepID=A0AAV1CWH1_OLDCO|nr:OLC1v1036889C1 [Oldenlandia corymbosa var. corymbosa]